MKKILLVDDKATIGRVLKIYLGTEYDLEYFESPLKALEWLNEGNVPDLIISDIHMPHMRGNEFLYYLKGNELFKHIPVVMLSSEESTVERIQLLEAGAADYILKPFNPLELRARIKKCRSSAKATERCLTHFICPHGNVRSTFCLPYAP